MALLTIESLRAAYEALKLKFNSLLQVIQVPMPTQTPAGNKIYEKARDLFFSGADASPANVAPSSLACAETVNYIVFAALGSPIGGGVSTNAMWKALNLFTTRWEQVLEPLPGDIIISPTGSVPGARLEHGHVGVVAIFGVLSNNSETGKLAETYDIRAWRAYYTEYGGLPTFFYRCIQKM